MAVCQAAHLLVSPVYASNLHSKPYAVMCRYTSATIRGCRGCHAPDKGCAERICLSALHQRAKPSMLHEGVRFEVNGRPAVLGMHGLLRLPGKVLLDMTCIVIDKAFMEVSNLLEVESGKRNREELLSLRSVGWGTFSCQSLEDLPPMFCI